MANTTGLNNPTLAYNPSGVSDWSTQMPFIDIMKSSRGFLGHTADKWGGVSHGDLVDNGFLDADGWPTEIPDEVTAIGTIWAWGNSEQSGVAESRSGTYVMKYDGEGDFRLSGVDIISQTDGEVVFTNVNGGTMSLNITDTDPDGDGNYLRNFSIVKEEHVELHEAGQLFNPDWIELVADARQFRFMDWMETNNSDQSEWSDRPMVDDQTWTGGVPVEVMVDLANQLGIDPWFTMPHLATDEYMREFAEYVRDNLDPNLKATVEYTNEAWNWAFNHTQDLLQMAADTFGTNAQGHANVNSYYAYKATQMALLWKDVYGEEAEDRLVTALGVQTGNMWTATSIFEAPTWRDADPENYVRPLDVFDAITGTTYFGGRTVSSADYRDELQAVLNDDSIDPFQWLADKLRDPEYGSSLPNVKANLEELRAVADLEGLDFIAYEGGQHVHHSFAVSEEAQAFEDFLTDFVRSPQMAELYEELWEIWEEVGTGPFMQFGDVGASSKYGSWGLRTGLFDTPPRAELLDRLNEDTEAWWEDRGGDHFKQGLTLIGDDSKEKLEGTSQEDFLIGAGGNDVLRGLAANDGLSGGAGRDKIFGGRGDDKIIGGGGRDTLDGDAGDDYINGGRMEDVLIGGRGKDTIYGQHGDDVINGDSGNDRLYGGSHNDIVSGGKGSDIVAGGSGDDALFGGDGNDTIISGADNDELTGGAGEDLFTFRIGHGDDEIHDFTSGEDLIRLADTGQSFGDLVIEDLGVDGTLVRYSDDDSILLTGVDSSQIDATDFTFV